MQSLVTVVALLLLLPQIRFTAQSYLSQAPPIHRQEECKVSPHRLNTKSILLHIPPTLVPTDTEPPRGRHCLANHNRTHTQSPGLGCQASCPGPQLSFPTGFWPWLPLIRLSRASFQCHPLPLHGFLHHQELTTAQGHPWSPTSALHGPGTQLPSPVKWY